LDAIERLVGLQAQVPRDPYVALWSRLQHFKPEALAEPIVERRAVRMTLFRSTLHLVTTRDALTLRPSIQEVVTQGFERGSPFGRRLAGLDIDEILAVGRVLLEERPRTRAELAPLLAERWPGRDADSLAYAVTYLLPLVQVTPRGIWGMSGGSAFTTLEHGLGRPLEAATPPDELVLRYLAAFGPATAADIGSWSGLTHVREMLERLRPHLRTLRDEDGRELFDVPGAPFPDPATPAPVRFLPEYDNVLIGHRDRTRIVPEGVPEWTGVGWARVLVDGFTAARWRMRSGTGGATLRIELFRKISGTERAGMEVEADRLARLPFGRPRRARRPYRSVRGAVGVNATKP
jgi:hypothetical protein